MLDALEVAGILKPAVGLVSPVERAGLEAEEPLDLGRPDHLAGLDVPAPRSHAGRIEHLSKKLVAFVGDALGILFHWKRQV